MIESLVLTFGEPLVGAGLGLLLGAIFGFLAQRSRFCMRSAVIEASRGAIGERASVWLLAVGVAIVSVQAAMLFDLVSADAIRPLNGRGSLSGAAIGGFLFGAGMILSRGCVSRLLVLSSTGNLRALLTGLVFVVVALATMRGQFGVGREFFGQLSSVEGTDNLSLLRRLNLGNAAGILAGLGVVAAALYAGFRHGLTFRNGALATLIGLAVGATYALTAALNAASFDPQPVRGLSFIAPSANALNVLLTQIGGKLDFDLGLIPGVVLGAFAAGLIGGELKLEGFHDGYSMRRYILGAILMGFGGVLAGGCSMGNGVSGSAIFSTTAVVALIAMWVGATATDALVDRPRALAANTPSDDKEAVGALVSVLKP